MAEIKLCAGDKKHIKVQIPYNASLIRLVKTVPGREWVHEDNAWYVPRSTKTLKHILKTFSGHNVTIDPSLQYLYKVARKMADTKKSYTIRGHERRGSIRDRKIKPKSAGISKRIEAFEKMIEHEMLKRHYSPRTIKLYKNILLDYFRYFNKGQLQKLTIDDVKMYLSNLMFNRDVSASRQKQVLCALRFLYEKLYRQKSFQIDFPIARKEKKQPNVLSKTEILAIIKAVDSEKHQLALELIYGSGLRVSEVSKIRINDIDIKNKRVRIVGGKGKKDRVTILSPKVIPKITMIVKSQPKSEYLIKGGWSGHRLAPRSLQKIFQKALEISGVKKRATCQTLRHSFATHLMENGVEVRVIQELLGQKTNKATEIYAAASASNKKKIISPL